MDLKDYYWLVLFWVLRRIFSMKGKCSLYLHSENCIASILYLSVTLHNNVGHQGELVHTCCQSPELWVLASFLLVKGQHMLVHTQILLTMRFQHSPMSYPKTEQSSHQADLTSSHNSLGLRKQPTFCKATTGSPVKWCLRNKRKSSILMMCHYPDWVVVLIGWSVSVINQKHCPDLGSDISPVWNFYNSCSSECYFAGKQAVTLWNFGVFSEALKLLTDLTNLI